LSVPATLTNVQVVNAQEGQAANGSIVATNQSITLRAGLNGTVNVSAATVNASNPKVPTITVNGANDSSVINLASGNDIVTLGSANETVNGGTGNDQFQVTAATIGATINGGTGSSTLNVLGGGANVSTGSNITNISAVMLATGLRRRRPCEQTRNMVG
jgi:Ca2+-binding RTX toxin-like protein